MTTPTAPSSAAPAVATQTVDDKVLELFNQVRSRQRDLAAASQAPRYITSCTLGRDPASVKDRVNIQTVTDTAVLVDLLGFLLMQEDYWSQASASLGLSVVTSAGSFRWMATR